MIRLIAVAFVLAVAHLRKPCHLRRFISRTAWSRKSARHAVRECIWSMVSAYVLPPAGTPPGVRLGCVQWVAVALNERLQRAGSEGLKPLVSTLEGAVAPRRIIARRLLRTTKKGPPVR